MRSRTKLVACAAALAALLGASVTARAQQSGPPGPPPPGGGPGGGVRGFYRQMGPGPFGDDVIGFVGVEAGLGRKTVTGAPFSATFSQQTTQTLGDGNHIQRTTSGTIARDSNGRTHRDLTLPAIGEWATAGRTPPHVVLINDPVANVNYVLEPDRKVAEKMLAFSRGNEGKGPKGEGLGPFAQERLNESTTVSLGTQMVNGVSAQGTRTTRTIPAGAIGNEKPMVITVERWYSPDLQMNVMIKRSDPRTGENVFQLTNIVRSEPEASLFQVPADYAMRQGGNIMARKGPPPPPPPPQN
jgi:hypothetical protein